MLKSYLAERKETVDKVLVSYLEELEYPNVIAEGMRYAVIGGGKRIRPILVLMVLNLLGKDEKIGLASGAGIECIHSYSLVHDDLPAIDNDDYRRGQLTTHKKFGEAEGILIGDALLTHAFNILTEKNKDIAPEKIVEIVKLTSSYSGINGMIGGQMIDIQSEGMKVDKEILEYIHENKTGKLIRLAVETGCILGDATLKERECLIKYSELIGLAFQIKDDLLDIEGDFETLGKPIGSDIDLHKMTYPALLGVDKTKELLNKIILEAKQIILENFSEEKSVLFVEFADFMGDRVS